MAGEHRESYPTPTYFSCLFLDRRRRKGDQTALEMSAISAFHEVWRWDGGTAYTDVLSGGAVDKEGNIVLVGTMYSEAVASSFDDDTFSDASSGDFAAVKLNGAGDRLWTSTTFSFEEYEMWNEVETDSNDDVLIGGTIEEYWPSNPYGGPHAAVKLAIKLDGGTGEEVWRYPERSPDSYWDDSSSYGGWGDTTTVDGVAVDYNDDVYLVGQVYGSVDGEGDEGDSHCFVFKLDGTDGSEIWAEQGGGSSYDVLRAVKADHAGDIVVAGIRSDVGSTEFVVMKYGGATGSFLWEYSTATSSTDESAQSIDVDDVGDVYVAGAFQTDYQQVNALGLLVFVVSLLFLMHIFKVCNACGTLRAAWTCARP